MRTARSNSEAMVPFLKQVASRYFDADLGGEDICFILPNRRSVKFFEKYWASLASERRRPSRMPLVFTISDFFCRISGRVASDRTHLLLILYECYKRLGAGKESLDDFIFWGDVLLSDFDDTDKYMADPAKLFTNVSDFKGMQDKFEYLSEGQREAMERFMSHFRTPGEDKPVKQSFLSIWEVLLPLYNDFRSELDSRGLAYEGMVFRSVAEEIAQRPVSDMLGAVFPGTGLYVFAGLNALSACEEKLLSRMRDAGLARFCWDFSSDMIRDSLNRASHFMWDNVRRFPQDFRPDPDGTPVPKVSVISVPSSVGQAKQLPRIFAQRNPGLETAVVLPDENLLLSVLNSIPPEVKAVNVTMGYSMRLSQLFALLSEVAAMQLHLRPRPDGYHFYHKQVYAIFSNSLFRSAASSPEEKEFVARIKAGARYYIPESELRMEGISGKIFRPVVEDPSIESPEVIKKITEYLSDIVSSIAIAIKEDTSLTLELDFAKEYYLILRRLSAYELPLRPATFFRMLDRLAGSLSVPFRGEPLKGLQIMGPLETRALDFERVIILSCNEGTYPSRSFKASFIPPELRRAFGLPNSEQRDAIESYYFYRLIQRASEVFLLYDSRTEGLKSGEESRYIRQLQLHFGLDVSRQEAKAFPSLPKAPADIAKTEADVEKIRAMEFSPSALRNYLRCQVSFYYSRVLGLKAGDEVTESLDSSMTGNVYHAAMQKLYSEARGTLTREYLRQTRRDRQRIKSLVRSLIMKELGTAEVSGRNLVFEEMVVRYVEKTLERDLELLEKWGTDSLQILGLEREMRWESGPYHFKGTIDRLDSIAPGRVRIVDYKTGMVEDKDLRIDDTNASKVIESLFAEENDKRPDIALQLFLYDKFVSSDGEFAGMRLFNSIYQPAKMFAEPPATVAVSEVFCNMAEERLFSMLEKISDISVPFRHTANQKACEHCDFKTICGR